MGIQDLQAFLESTTLDGGSVSVDLLKIARNVTQRQQPHNSNRKIRPICNKYKLIIDAENCLDRLYGGYFSDWACGGQWNRMVQFLSLLTQAVERGNIELAVVFNGTIEKSRMNEWVAQQAAIRQKVGMVLKHVNTKATPPPKIWWTAPICLKTALRMALRHLGISVMCTMDDHHQEVIAYCREYGFHGLLADDAEYATFNPPRYFSSEHIKLTYKGSLETKEYMVSELIKSLQLSQDQICVLASLLGNFLLPESELQDVYKKIQSKNAKTDAKINGEVGVKLLAVYVRTLPLPVPSNMDVLVKEIFGSAQDKRAAIFKQSVLYYLNGTADGFLKYCTPKISNSKHNKNKQNQQHSTISPTIKAAAVGGAGDAEADLNISVFASETSEQEQESLQQYKLATVNQVLAADIINLVDTDTSSKSSPRQTTPNTENFPPSDLCRLNGHTAPPAALSNGGEESVISGIVNLLVSSPPPPAIVINAGGGDNNTPTSPKQKHHAPPTCNIINPSASADVLRTSSLRHQKGLMSPWILHVLSSKEVRLPCVMEDETNREFPPIHEIYLPLRQRIYAVLFNLHHHRYVHAKKKESGDIGESAAQPDVIIKEWVYSRTNPYQSADEVKAEPLPWAVPTLQRLWFGPSLDDKRRRMRALLSCLNSDTPLILNISYVPQHMLVMACVLRYVMSQEKAILRRSELDVFLCHAFNPDLMNAQYLQELTLGVVTTRGVQLAAVFMEGVDTALLANDACGAPLPWLMCCPWLYFDGKLFHHTLTRSTHAKSLLDLCENHIDRVVKVERIRKAILEGLDIKFAKIPLPQYGGPHMRSGIPPPNCLPSVPLPSSRGAANLRHRPMSSRGGQLQIAGVVVGSWGANYGYQNLRQQPHHHHQQHAMPQQQQQQGYHHRGAHNNRAAGQNNYQPSSSSAQQYYHQQTPRGGAGAATGRQQQQRKAGPPTFAMNKRNNANRKRNNNKQKQAAAAAGGGAATPRVGLKTVSGTFTVKTDNGDVAVTTNKDHSSDDEAVFEDCKGGPEHHHGQGDGPASPAAPLALEAAAAAR